MKGGSRISFGHTGEDLIWRNPKECSKRMLELTNEFRKVVTRYRQREQSFAFLYTNQIQLNKTWRTQFYLQWHQKEKQSMNCLVKNLAKEAKTRTVKTEKPCEIKRHKSQFHGLEDFSLLTPHTSHCNLQSQCSSLRNMEKRLLTFALHGLDPHRAKY